MSQNKAKQFYLTVKGEKVPVTEEVYRAYVRPIRAEQRTARRKSRCLVEGVRSVLVRCTKDCSNCPYSNSRNLKSANDLSLDGLAESGFDMVEPLGLEDRVIEEELQEIEMEALREGIKQLNERQQLLVHLYFFEGKTLQEISALLGVGVSAIGNAMTRIYANLNKFINNF